MANGLTHQQIADELGITEATIRSHASAIYLKLHVKNRTQAVVKAQLWGIIVQPRLNERTPGFDWTELCEH